MRALILFLWLTLTACAQNLVWHDEFDGSSLDRSKWKNAFTGTRLSGYNCPESVRVANGCLEIHVQTKDGYHCTGMISTEDSFRMNYGYWEARMKFNDTSSTWSDFWLYSLSVPFRVGCEIDIVEHRKFDKLSRDIGRGYDHTLHWDGYEFHHKCAGQRVEDIGDDFHVFGMEWDEFGYTFYIDNKPTCHLKKPHAVEPLFIIFSTEIDDKGWAGPVPKSGYDQTTMWVDYVRVFDRKP